MGGAFGTNPRQTYTFGSAPGGSVLTLTVSGGAGNLIWNAPSGTWDTGISTNWYNVSTSAADTFYSGDNVTFNDLPGGTSPES